MTPRQKRIAVEQALANYISGAQLAQALQLWDEKYAHQPTFALQHFLRELCADGELLQLRSRLLQAMVHSFSGQQDTLASSSAQRKNEEQARLRNTPELIAFMQLCNTLFAAAGINHASRIRFYVLQNLPALHLGSRERWALHSWLNQSAPQLEQPLQVSSMQKVINQIYIALCEYLGPVRADQLLQTCVSKTQSQYPGFNLSQLL